MHNLQLEYYVLQDMCDELQDMSIDDFLLNQEAGFKALGALTDQEEPAITIHEPHRGFVVIPGDAIDLMRVADEESTVSGIVSNGSPTHVLHLSIMAYGLAGKKPVEIQDFFEKGNEAEPITISHAVLLYIKYFTVHTLK